MSAEEEAIELTQQINRTITQTLEELRNSRKDMRKLSDEEKNQFNLIITNLNQITKNLKEYIKRFRVQSTLLDFKQTDE